MPLPREGVRLGPHESEDEIATKCRPLLAFGPVRVKGSDSWTLQRLVTVACQESLEIRDPRGALLRCADRLVNAHGSTRHGKRVRQRWTVEVLAPTVNVPEGCSHFVDGWGAGTDGRRVVFTQEAAVHLWERDLT